ncbi:MAG: AAA family ATPase [Puniceicoccaceae bacterium]
METEQMQRLAEQVELARNEIRKVIIGHEQVIDLALATIVCQGHALLEGVPGVAKTLLVKTMARVLGQPFSRVQFTPDLMPADITGTTIYHLEKKSFELIQGPIFTTFLLADEINRAPAKTQSALLEAMQERQVTIDRTSHLLSSEFTVFATQNPVESEGTYPLAEAQKDRFLMGLSMDYPSPEEEHALAMSMSSGRSPESILKQEEVQVVLSPETITDIRATIMSLEVKEEVVNYMVSLIRATREHEAVLIGAGPRATQSLLLVSRTLAAFDGRDYVTPDDIREAAGPVILHRLILRPEYEMEGLTPSELLTQILQSVAVPR